MCLLSFLNALCAGDSGGVVKCRKWLTFQKIESVLIPHLLTLGLMCLGHGLFVHAAQGEDMQMTRDEQCCLRA